jgi:hypothetical protein
MLSSIHRYLFANLMIMVSSGSLFSQPDRDTSLLMLYSVPAYFNVVREWSGTIYAGTSDGIYRMDGIKPIKIDNRKGYLRIDEQGKIAIDSNGVRYHRQSAMSHLLPFPEEKKNEHHAGNGGYFYITAGGRMHVYEARPYGYVHRNHSIRSVSAHFTATYSGIYYRNRPLKLPFPQFSDGYIREYNGKVFVSSYNLDVFDINQLSDSTEDPKKIRVANGFDFTPCRDIRYLSFARQYLVASGNRLIELDSNLDRASVLFTGQGEDELVLLNENVEYQTIHFGQGKNLYEYRTDSRTITKLNSIEQQILDGDVKPQQKLVLTSNAILHIQNFGTKRRAEGIQKAHTLLPIEEMEYVIATDLGLYHFNLQDNKLSVLIPNVEFNRRGLYQDGKKLYAGSINGLYILDLNNLYNIIDFNQKQATAYSSSPPYGMILSLIGVILILIILVMFYRKKSITIQAALDESVTVETKPRLTLEDIESYIRENLTTASLKTIVAHFNTNTSMVYTILDPEKPGDLIQKIRFERIKELRAEGKTAKEIGELTGFSETYVRKIWNKG